MNKNFIHRKTISLCITVVKVKITSWSKNVWKTFLWRQHKSTQSQNIKFIHNINEAHSLGHTNKLELQSLISYQNRYSD